MAQRLKPNEIFTFTDGNEVEFILDALVQGDAKTTVWIEVITASSGVRFASGEAVDSTKHYARPAGSNFPMSANNKDAIIRGKGAAGDSIVATW